MLCQEGGGGKSGLEMKTVCVCVNMYSLIRLCVCACTCVSAHVFTHMGVYVYACILSQDYMCVCMCIHDCVCAHAHIYPLTYLEHKAWDPICRVFSLPHTPIACVSTRITNELRSSSRFLPHLWDHRKGKRICSGSWFERMQFLMVGRAWSVERLCLWQQEREPACSQSCRSDAEAGSGDRH